MDVRLDEAGGDEPAADVHRFAGGLTRPADADDAAVGDREINRRASRGDATVGEQKIEHRGTVCRKARER